MGRPIRSMTVAVQSVLPLNEFPPRRVSNGVVTTGEIVLSEAIPSRHTTLSLESAVAAHQQQVLRTAFRILGRLEDAQDAAQEVLLRLCRSWGQIEGDPAPW